jgi:hypothetical protein
VYGKPKRGRVGSDVKTMTKKEKRGKKEEEEQKTNFK